MSNATDPQSEEPASDEHLPDDILKAIEQINKMQDRADRKAARNERDRRQRESWKERMSF